MSSAEPDSVGINRGVWTRSNERYGDANALRQWRAPEIVWGTWSVPESELRALPDDLAGLDVAELGCGVAYFSAWLAGRGARPVGVDPTPAQLETARRCQQETGIEFPLLEGFGEAVPLPDSAFDLVLSEYGASIWADPYAWIPEAARILRPGGALVFLRSSTFCAVRMSGRPSSSWCGRSSACTGSTGARTAAGSSSTSGTATGCVCCARTASRSSI
jgi:SAM-dependent methyltransferase